MAGDWLKWTKGLADKREIAVMALSLSRSRDELAAKCMRFWEWCDENAAEDSVTESGSVVIILSPRDGDNMTFIDSIVNLQGFAQAMVQAGWLILRASAIELPHFERHNLSTAKTRARNKVTQSHRRGKPPIPVTEMSPSHGDKTVTREEKRREENKEEEKTPQPPKGGRQRKRPPKDDFDPKTVDLPPPLTERFREFWLLWCAHRGEKRKELTPTAVREQVKKLADMGEERAIAAIRHSVANGYTGVFEPTSANGPTKKESRNDFLDRTLEFR